MFTKKASTEKFEENDAIRKERYKNARDGAREKVRKEVGAKDKLIIVDFMKEAMKRHNMITRDGKRDFWDEVMDKYNITKARLKKMYREHEKDETYVKEQKTANNKRYMAKGMRKTGGGRESIAEFAIEDLDAWVHQEYSMGHQMDKSDILE